MDVLLQRFANSLKIRAGVPIDIRNAIEEKIFLNSINSRATEDMQIFVDLIRRSFKNCDLVFLSKLKDGCYPLLKAFDYSNTVAISVGVGNNILLDESLARLGCTVHLFDHTIDNVSLKNEFRNRITFHKVGLAAETQENFMSMSSMIQYINDTLKRKISLVKIDCEGCEWSSLTESAILALSKVDQLIVEFHFLNKFTDQYFSSSSINLFNNILEYFDICYISPNNFSGSVTLDSGNIWPFTIEVMFINKEIAGQYSSEGTNSLPKLKNWKLGKSIDLSHWTSPRL